MSSQSIPGGPHPRAVFAWMGRDWRGLQRVGLDWRRFQGLSIWQFPDFGNSGNFACSPLPVFLSQRPHPPGRFVENKGPTAIRKAFQKPVDPSFFTFCGALIEVNFRPIFSFLLFGWQRVANFHRVCRRPKAGALSFRKGCRMGVLRRKSSWFSGW
jgi:hypothetical protein